MHATGKVGFRYYETLRMPLAAVNRRAPVNRVLVFCR